MNICIFEDEKFSQLYPLSLSRPIYELRCGIYSLAEKILIHLPKSRVYYHTREYLRPYLKTKRLSSLPKNIKHLKNCLFINGRILMNKQSARHISTVKDNLLFYYKGSLVAAHLTEENLSLVEINNESFSLKNNHIKKINVKTKMIEYLWELVHLNAEEIKNDAIFEYPFGTIGGKIYSNTTLINKENIYIGKKTLIKPGVVIDAKKGPVIIDSNTELMPNCVIIGPVYIGPNCKIKAGAKIYEGTSIGQVCKIGGEIEETIIQGYTNKQHEGFLGHSYIGSWCNLGADTNNSDLKNNYSNVDVIINGKKIDTGLTFVGLFMGDHSKSGINTMFNTGTVVGFSSNVFGVGYLPKYIPSFSWFDAQKGNQTYQIEKAIEVGGKVMTRRNVKFIKSDRDIFYKIFDLTKRERK